MEIYSSDEDIELGVADSLENLKQPRQVRKMLL